MKSLLLWIAIILLILWAIGALLSTIGDIIHILLVLAVISFLLRYVRGRRRRANDRIEK